VSHGRLGSGLVAAILATSATAGADPKPIDPYAAAAKTGPPPAPAPTPAAGPAPAPPPIDDAPTTADLAADLDDLTARTAALEAALHRADATHDQVESLLPLKRFVTAWIDVGAFAVAGDGSGIRSDLGHLYFPQYVGKVPAQWVFMGDPMSTAINSLNEPADTSDSRELPTDTIASHGHPAVLVNAVGLAFDRDVGHGLELAALAVLLPRARSTQLDLELARVDYRPSSSLDLVISAGKIDSVLGVEYRTQDATHRLGVAPSLICRYTCGRPFGVEARLAIGDLSTSWAITDSSFFDRRFQAQTLLKPNTIPTVAGHIQYRLPIGRQLMLGGSWAIGAEDNQPTAGVGQWHLGVDLQLRDLRGFDLTAEYASGRQDGATSPMALAACDVAACLTYKGAYVLMSHRVWPWWTPYLRVDWRDAVHLHGADFAYESHVIRATVGAHFAVTSRIVGKLEYTFNHELGGIPQFADDILTSSLVVATD
jgi:hypothetical protein